MSRPVSRYKRRGVKLTQHQAHLFDKLRAGERIVVTYRGGGETEYCLMSGIAVRAALVDSFRELGFLCVADPGLLGDQPQSYKLAPYSVAA